MWVIWKERNRRDFERGETSFAHLGRTLQSHIFFWCNHVVPVFVKRIVCILERTLLCRFLFFGIPLVYNQVGPAIINEIFNLIKRSVLTYKSFDSHVHYI